MCMGTPMVVIESDDMSAVCERGAETRRISMALLGAQPRGAVVLVHLDTAVRLLDAEEARLIDQAIEGLAAALRGEPFERFFADADSAAAPPELPPRPTTGGA